MGMRLIIVTSSPTHPANATGCSCTSRPFLGSSRLAAPIDQFKANAVFHGHAHHGVPQGKTDGGVPVYNVAMPMLERRTKDQRFVVVEI